MGQCLHVVLRLRLRMHGGVRIGVVVSLDVVVYVTEERWARCLGREKGVVGHELGAAE